jgi:hypothetical protein
MRLRSSPVAKETVGVAWTYQPCIPTCGYNILRPARACSAQVAAPSWLARPLGSREQAGPTRVRMRNGEDSEWPPTRLPRR